VAAPMLASESGAGREQPAWIRSSSRDRARVFEPVTSSRCRQLERASLGERLVEVAALRRLHTRWTAVAARTLTDQSLRVLDKPLELVIAAPGDPDSHRDGLRR